MNPFPFRRSAQDTDLARTISEIVAPKGTRPAPKPDKYGGKAPPPKPVKGDKGSKVDTKMYATEGIGSEGDTHGGGATSPKRNGASGKKRRVPAPVVGVPTTPRVTEPLKISEDHTLARLEKLSVGQLRALYKKYSAQAAKAGIPKGDLAQELANIRGLLRSKGGGSVLDEARKGLGKTAYGKALKGLGDAAAKIKANPPKPPVNPFKKSVDEACWKGYTAQGLKRKGNRAVPNCVKEETPCERAALARLKGANTEDLKEKGGKAGERAHKRLHKTIKSVLGESAVKAALEDYMYSIPPAAVEALRPVMKIKSLTKRFAAITKTLKAHGFTTRFMGSMPANVVNDYYDTFFGDPHTVKEGVGEEVESVDEGVLGRIKKKLQRAGEHLARAATPTADRLKDELWSKQNRHAIAAAKEKRKREAEEDRKRRAREAEEERKNPKPKKRTRSSDDDDWGRSRLSDGDDGGWMGAVGI